MKPNPLNTLSTNKKKKLATKIDMDLPNKHKKKSNPLKTFSSRVGTRQTRAKRRPTDRVIAIYPAYYLVGI